MARRWRLLDDADAPGPWNMGVDEALLASAASAGRATLRLYGWSGPWLSLGYAQGLDEARAAACARAGVGVVRRATGGRAVAHGADLTYAVAAPSDWLPEGLLPTYACIAAGLSAGLRELGLVTTRAPHRSASTAFDCFAAPAGDELCAGGRKLVGSAQRRVPGAVLQHGSLRLRPDPPAVRDAAGLGDHGTSLVELGLEAALPGLRSRLGAALAAALGAELVPGTLSAEERAQAAARSLGPRVDPGRYPPSPEGSSQDTTQPTDR